MASIRTIPYPIGRGDIYLIGECEGRTEFVRIKNLTLWEETEPKHKESSRKSQKGDTTMHDYQFLYKGGATRLDNANYKFHVFIVDIDANEHHLYGALKTGLVERDISTGIYSSTCPVVKVFTATQGFGVPKEFFSYFIMLSPEAPKLISIKPLGFKNIEQDGWGFSGKGRFLTRDEIRKFFGSDSDTWKFYQRQSFLSKVRLSEMVEISLEKELTGKREEATTREAVRMLRFD